MVGAVLMDVGGTLWPDAWPARIEDLDERASRLGAAATGQLAHDEARSLASDLTANPPQFADGGRQDTDREVVARLEELELAEVLPDPAAVRRAMCLPARGHLELLPGAAELLRQLTASGVRVVLVSNALWRDSATYLADFSSLGLEDAIHGAISSVDVGFRKPHSAMFEAALGAARLPARQCAVVGDSERNDIDPGRRLGCVTVRVAIEEPVPDDSAADVVLGSLEGAARELLR